MKLLARLALLALALVQGALLLLPAPHKFLHAQDPVIIQNHTHQQQVGPSTPVNTRKASGPTADTPLLLLLLSCLPVAAAQDPVGAYSECGPGRTYRIQCYVGPSGYLTDVVYRNTVPPTDIAICNAPQQQLQQSVMTQLEISASDSFIRMLVFEDDWGVRGIALNTLLGERLECGSTAGKPTAYSSRSIYPLGGFTGSCAANGAPALPKGPQGRANQHAGHGLGHSMMPLKQQRALVGMGQQAGSSTRVTRVFGACWNTQSTPQAAGKQGVDCSLRWS
jgi:hypothetical protein